MRYSKKKCFGRCQYRHIQIKKLRHNDRGVWIKTITFMFRGKPYGIQQLEPCEFDSIISIAKTEIDKLYSVSL